MQTLKQRCWAKGIVSTGTAGIGYIYCDPRVAAVNDLNSIFFSSALYTGNNFQPNLTLAGVNQTRTNSAYLSTQFTTGGSFAYRVVSCGIRVRWRGTELNRGGQLVCLQNPNHQPLTGFVTTNMDSFQQSVRLPIEDKKWTNVLFRPVDSEDLNFRKTFPDTVLCLDADSYYMGIMIEAPSGGTGGQFEFEVYANHEFTGYSIRGQTPSHVDPNGFSAVHAVTNFTNHLLPSNLPSAALAEQFVDAAAGYLADGISWGISNAPRILATAPHFASALALTL